jgi:hypothetical protein
MNKDLTDNEILLLLILVFLVLTKVVFSGIVHFSKHFHKLGLSDKVFDYIKSTKTFYSSLINIIATIVGIYFIFIKKITGLLFILSFIVILKSILHFTIEYDLYKQLNLSPNTENLLIDYKKYESIITNYVLFFFTLYILKYVFF